MAVKDEQEWFRQAEFDIGSADTMYKDGRYNYAVFMCHLSIEKALKAVFYLLKKSEPPRTHDLVFLVRKNALEMPENLYDFIEGLSSLSVPTRYPEDLQRILKDFDNNATGRTIKRTKEVLEWLKPLLNQKS
jgi:HEPN domain-containing protein